MPLAHSHPWQPIPVKEEEDNADHDVEVVAIVFNISLFPLYCVVTLSL